MTSSTRNRVAATSFTLAPFSIAANTWEKPEMTTMSLEPPMTAPISLEPSATLTMLGSRPNFLKKPCSFMIHWSAAPAFAAAPTILMVWLCASAASMRDRPARPPRPAAPNFRTSRRANAAGTAAGAAGSGLRRHPLVEAAVDLACIAFEDLVLVLGREAADLVDVALGVVVMVPG